LLDRPGASLNVARMALDMLDGIKGEVGRVAVPG
jgi:hypothetical protein